jgi:hypothetical protein
MHLVRSLRSVRKFLYGQRVLRSAARRGSRFEGGGTSFRILIPGWTLSQLYGIESQASIKFESHPFYYTPGG